MKKQILSIITIYALVFATNTNAQNTFPASGSAGIGTSTPHSTAALDISSTSKGVLFQRMTIAQRNAIVSPAQGLLIYQTDITIGLYQYNGSAWKAVTTTNSVRGLINNLFIGQNAGISISTGTGNIGLGKGALKSITVQSNNIALGDSALYSNGSVSANTYEGRNNVAIGNKALKSNTRGSYNSAFGNEALINNSSGIENTAIGYSTLHNNTAGSSNSAFGNLAMYANTTGNLNSAFGISALLSNTVGVNNVALGAFSLKDNTIGTHNSAMGCESLKNNTVGIHNTAIGDRALLYNTTGDYNVAIGSLAGYYTDNSNNCTFLGYDAGQSSLTNFANSTAVGNNSRITANAQVRIGNLAVNSIGGYANWSTLSDGRFKRDIKADVPGLDFINKLRPVTYHYDVNKLNQFIYRDDSARFTTEEMKTKEAELQTGFIAQEVESAARELNYDFSGVDKPKNADDTYGLRYAEFVVPMVKGMQELSKTNEELKMENVQLENRIENLTQEIAEIKKALNLQTTSEEQINKLKVSEVELSVNQLSLIPNPVKNFVTIRFANEKEQEMELQFIDASGKVVKTAISFGSEMQINTNDLASGTYLVELFNNGKLIASKKLSVIK
ncbi:MAG: T9SS type A sorting domain-containing protein [Bacteroidia bacterium]